MNPGPRNLITDVPGLLVGNAEDHRIKTGVTVLTADKPFIASVDVMGGSPGARETDLLAPDKLVESIDAIFLSGGSAFGLDAGSGISIAREPIGKLWVRDDGEVLEQETRLANLTFRFVRQDDESCGHEMPE